MEEMADAGEAYGELLELIRKDLSMKKKEKMLKDIVSIPLEKHYTCEWGKQQTFPYDDDWMMLIIIGDLMMSRYGYERGDDHQILVDNHQKLPKIIKDMLTWDLDFHQKEHLRKCRYQPDDWKIKSLRLKRTLRGDDISPDVINLNITWQQSSPQHVLTTLNMIPSKFKLSDMLEIGHGTIDKTYYFKGMIWFWGNHYYWYIRHITEYGESWIEYNDKSLYKIPDWEWIVSDSVTTCSNPTLLVFENINTVLHKKNISDLYLSEDFLEEMQAKSFKKTRAGEAGRIDLTQKSTSGLIMEGAENFPTHSGPDVAYFKTKGGNTSESGPTYGVTKSHTKDEDDDWRCSYCYKLNSAGT